MTTTLERPQDATPTGGPLQPRPPRSPLNRKLVGAVVAVVVLASALAIPLSLGLVPSVYQPPLSDDAAMAIGGDEVSVADYDKRVKTLKSLYGAQPPGDPAGQDAFRRDAAKSVAVSLVMKQALADRDIVIPDPQVRQQLTGMVAAQFGQAPDAYGQFLEGLRQAGSSEPEVFEEIRQQIGMTVLVEQIAKEVPEVRDDELPAEFPKYAAALGVPEQRRIANIVVPSREQAQDLVNQARGGIPFADIARRASIDAATRDKGGDLGEPITKDKLQPGYNDAAFAAAKGEVFGPVQTPQGWNAGQVLDVIPGKLGEYQASIIPLKSIVTSQRKLDHWKQWFETTLQDANVRYADAYRPSDPDGASPALQGAAPPQPGQPAPAPR